MAGKVREQIDGLATSNSDSTQWSLAQIDVELLALKAAIFAAEVESDSDLAEVRKRFDIFYSRVRTVSISPLYASLRTDPETVDALVRINRYLDDVTPVIDGSQEVLRTSLPELAVQTEAIRPVVRQISLEGVSMLAQEADGQRRSIAETLYWVSALTTGSFLVLVLLLGLLLHFVRRERHRAHEESLVRSRLSSIISTSLDAILVVGRDGRVIEFNGAAENIFGYSRAEALGAQMEDLIIPEHFRKRHDAGMKRYLSTGEKHVIGKGRVQLEARRKSGEVFPVELSISTADSDGGEIFVSFLRDISRRITSEQELIQARDKAVAGEKAKADLIAVMSHEMRTPLNGMLGTLELLEPDRRNPKDAEYLEIIRASGRQLLHHVDNVLEISRVESGKIVLAQDVFSVRALVHELVESQRSVAEHRGNAISEDVDTGGRDYVVGDPTRIRQVLLNLVGNAIKFTRNGSIAVAARSLPGSDIVEFRVSDTGIGIDPEDRSRVFDDFVTLDTSYSRAAGGTGLGLSIVKRFVEAMGGEVGLESVKGEGSTFHVRLPLPAPSEAAPAREREPSTRTARQDAEPVPPLKVLIVEDNRINRIVLRDLLEQDGHNVEEAHDGQEGADLARRKSFDLILMDISMPVLDGVEATRAIRQAEARGTRLPIVAITAHALPADKERFRAAGLDDILVKPISRDSLRAIVKRFSKHGRRTESFQPHAVPATALLDHAHFDSLADAIGSDKIRRLLAEFLSEMEEAIGAISASIETGDIGASLRGKVHLAAGSSAMFGAEALRSELAKLEAQLLEGSELDARTSGILRETWAQTVRELRRHEKAD